MLITIDDVVYTMSQKYVKYFENYNILIYPKNIIKETINYRYTNRDEKFGEIYSIYDKIIYKNKTYLGTFIEIDGYMLKYGAIVIDEKYSYQVDDVSNNPLVFTSDSESEILKWKLIF